MFHSDHGLIQVMIQDISNYGADTVKMIKASPLT